MYDSTTELGMRSLRSADEKIVLDLGLNCLDFRYSISQRIPVQKPGSFIKELKLRALV